MSRWSVVNFHWPLSSVEDVIVLLCDGIITTLLSFFKFTACTSAMYCGSHSDISFVYIVYLQLTGKCGSVLVRLIPAPRGTGIVAAGVPKKLLNMAGVSDCYTSARGQTATLGNFGESVL